MNKKSKIRDKSLKRVLKESVINPSEGIKVFVDYLEKHCYDWGDLYDATYDNDFMYNDGNPRWSAIAYGGNDSVEISIKSFGDGFAAYVDGEEFIDDDPLKLAEVVREKLTHIIDIQESIIMNKKQIRLTESDLKQIVKESVNRILQENRSLYDDVMKDELQEPFNSLEETAQKLIAILHGGVMMKMWGYTAPGYAKRLGYTKSYKRLANALKCAEKAKELISAAKQDMLGEYGNMEEPQYQPHDHLPYEGGQDYGFGGRSGI